MRVRLVGLLAWVGCGASQTIAPAAEPEPMPPRPAPTFEPTIPDLEPMFAVPAPPRPETRCRSFPVPDPRSRGVTGGAKRVVYDFMEMPLGAVERGPRTNVRERRADPMTSAALHRPFARRADQITRCWKWFAATHPGGDTQLDVRLTIDTFGATGGANIINAPEDADLAACVRDAFASPQYLYGPRLYAQQTHAMLHFERADQPAWKKRPLRPAPPPKEPEPARGTTCVRVLPGTIHARLYPLLVTDFDPSRVPPPLPGSHRVVAPQIRIGCTSTSSMVSKLNLRGALESNWGALQACHAAARTRIPTLSGTVSVKVLFDAGGAEPPLAMVTGAGDAELHACIDAAVEETWLAPPANDSLIEANFTLRLVDDDRDETLPPMDREGWRARFASVRSSLDGCVARDDLVTDRLRAAPATDDARVRAAFRELASFIAALPRDQADACLDKVGHSFSLYTAVNHDTREATAEVHERALDRLEAVRPLVSIAPWGKNLELAIAVAYRKDPARFDEGTRILRLLALDPAFEGMRIDDAPRPIANTCLR